jgi:hypothetical protein
METAVYNFVHNFSLKCVRVFGVFFIFATQLNNMERVKMNTDEILSRICAITPSDKTSVGVGTYMVKDVVPVENLLRQIKTKGVENLFWNIR